MKTTSKKLGIVVAFAAFALCSGFGMASLNAQAQTDVNVPTTLELTSFKTNFGASIRAEAPAGIRFAASISKTDYEKLAGKDYEFGMAFVKGNCTSVSQLKELVKTNESQILKPNTENRWSATNNPNTGTSTYEYTYSLVGIDSASYNTYYTALAYVKVDGTLYYSTVENETDTVRTPLWVAVSHLNAGYTADTFVQGIVDSALTGKTIAFDEATYTLTGENVTPKILLDGKEVPLKITSENPDVVKVEDGELVGVSKGTTKIVASIQGKDATYSCEANVSVESFAVTPTIAKNGIMTLNTAEEETTISLYKDGALVTTLAENVTDETYDVYDAIIDYRVQNGIKAEVAYEVKVESDSYVGNVATKKFVPLTSANDFYNKYNSNQNSASEEGYYYLTKDIEFSNMTGNNMLQKAKACLDGRGYKVYTPSMTDRTNGTSAAFAGQLEDVYIKNLVFDYSAMFGSKLAKGLFVGDYIVNSTLENCYIKVTLDLENGAKNAKVIGGLDGSVKFTNCVFEINDVNQEDEYRLLLSDNASKATFTNCAYITTDTGEMFDKGTISGTLTRYDSVSAFASVCATWGEPWSVSATNIQLCGKDIRKYGKETVTPTIAKNGIMTLKTAEEATTISLYKDGSLVTTLAENVTDSAYDVYDAIIDYRVQNGIKAEVAYEVKVESDSYVGSVATKKFVPLTSANDFYTKYNSTQNSRSEEGYYYLTQDITFSNMSGSNMLQKAKACLDGRGYKVYTASTADRTNGVSAAFAGQLEGVYIKNLVFDYSVKFGSKLAKGLFVGDYIVSSTLENCYIKVTLDLVNGAKNAKVIGGLDGTVKFTNCVFEINDVNQEDDYRLLLSDNASKATFTNCAYITTDTGVMFDKGTVSGTLTRYDSVSAFASANTTWATPWEITTTSIKLKGKAVQTIA